MKKKHMDHSPRKQHLFFAIKMAFLAVCAVTTLLPFYWVIVSSVKSTAQIYASPLGFPHGFRFTNYKAAWEGALIYKSFFNSLLYSASAVLIIAIVASMVSYVIVRQKWGRYLFIYFSLGIMIPLNAVIIPLDVILKQIGILNTRIGITTAFTVGNLSFGVFIISAFMRGLPIEIEEAARIDGCSRVRLFANIILPMSKSGLATAGTLAFINCWNDLLLSMTVISTSSLNTLNYAVYSLKGQYVTDYGIITAGMMIMIVPAIIIYGLFQEQIIKGTISGAIKG